MRISTLTTAFSLAFCALAAPINERRQQGELRIIYETSTTIVDYVVWTTTTVTEDETPATSTPTPVAAFYEASTTSVTLSSVVPTPLAVVPAAALIPVSSAAVVAPSATSTPPSVATSTVQAASSPVVVAAAAPVVASTSTTAAAAVSTPTASTSSSSSGDYPYTGDMTYYDVSVGLGSCGVSGTNSQNLVALPAGIMANGVNPNANPKCGKQIEISYNGAVHTATVFDTCPSCTGGSIDLPQPLFQAIAPAGDGRVSGVSWRFVD